MEVRYTFRKGDGITTSPIIDCPKGDNPRADKCIRCSNHIAIKGDIRQISDSSVYEAHVICSWEGETK